MGDAGWGGPMHATHLPGDSRVHSASAEGLHVPAVATSSMLGCTAGDMSSAALQEANMLSAAQGHNVSSSSAKTMSDESLVGIMNGHEATQ